VAVESQTTQLRTPLPDAKLPDVDGVEHDLQSLAAGAPLLVVFACNHCPYVRWLEQDLGRLITETGVHAVAINSNDVNAYPEDGPDGMREQLTRAGWDFPYLIDADQALARALGAVCTPDFFLYDAAGLLAYRGAFDASSPKNGQPRTGDLLRAAIADVLAGRPVPEPHRHAMGCGIKWKQS
jgi:thiol-disulfide isomerase/thioredoxin